MKNRKQILNYKNERDESDSENEYNKKNLFESSVFWRHENEKRKATLFAKDS